MSRRAPPPALRCAGAVAALASLGAAAAPAPAGLPPDTVLLLVAPWCPPCWRELARLDELAAAASPKGLRVVAMEEGPRARAMVADLPPEQRWTPAPRDRAAVRLALWTRASGLPFGLVTDARGAVCAWQGGALDGAGARALVARCGAGAGAGGGAGLIEISPFPPGR